MENNGHSSNASKYPSNIINATSGYSMSSTGSMNTTSYYVDINGNTHSGRIHTGNALSSVDSDGKIEMTHNNIHIQPASNGFVVTKYDKKDGISTYCFSDYKGVAKFLNDLSLMDLDSELVADNV